MDWSEARVLFNQKQGEMLSATEKALTLKDIRRKRAEEASEHKEAPIGRSEFRSLISQRQREMLDDTDKAPTAKDLRKQRAKEALEKNPLWAKLSEWRGFVAKTIERAIYDKP